jgi:hypothetical protein
MLRKSVTCVNQLDRLLLQRKILNSEKNANSACEKRVAGAESWQIIPHEKRAVSGQHKNFSRPPVAMPSSNQKSETDLGETDAL